MHNNTCKPRSIEKISPKVIQRLSRSVDMDFRTERSPANHALPRLFPYPWPSLLPYLLMQHDQRLVTAKLGCFINIYYCNHCIYGSIKISIYIRITKSKVLLTYFSDKLLQNANKIHAAFEESLFL